MGLVDGVRGDERPETRDEGISDRAHGRPSPDHANAQFILLISAHLESGHYFNPHAQRIIEGMMNGAKLAVMDTRLSNTASMADHWMATYPGTEAAVLLAMANIIIKERLYNEKFLRDWVNWQDSLVELRKANSEKSGSPPYEGGVAAASADGVVFTPPISTDQADHPTKSHPFSETPTPLLHKEGSPHAFDEFISELEKSYAE